jgi:hypothetical protein
VRKALPSLPPTAGAHQASQQCEGGREDAALKEEAELAMIDRYLPAQLTPAEIAELISAAISEAGATEPKDLGSVMKILQPKTAGRADGKAVSMAVREALAKMVFSEDVAIEPRTATHARLTLARRFLLELGRTRVQRLGCLLLQRLHFLHPGVVVSCIVASNICQTCIAQ